MGGSLKAIPSENKGLKKLPTYKLEIKWAT